MLLHKDLQRQESKQKHELSLGAFCRNKDIQKCIYDGLFDFIADVQSSTAKHFEECFIKNGIQCEMAPKTYIGFTNDSFFKKLHLDRDTFGLLEIVLMRGKMDLEGDAESDNDLEDFAYLAIYSLMPTSDNTVSDNTVNNNSIDIGINSTGNTYYKLLRTDLLAEFYRTRSYNFILQCLEFAKKYEISRCIIRHNPYVIR